MSLRPFPFSPPSSHPPNPTQPPQAAAAAQGEAIKQEGRIREGEAARAKAEGEAAGLKARLAAAEAAAEEKGKVGRWVLMYAGVVGWVCVLSHTRTDPLQPLPYPPKRSMRIPQPNLPTHTLRPATDKYPTPPPPPPNTK